MTDLTKKELKEKNNYTSTQSRKNAMVKAMKGQLGVVALACQEVGIARNTHYTWLKEDPEYAKQIEEVPETVLDFAEHALHKLIDQGNVTAIIFFLKTQAKKRGYIEINANQYNTINQDSKLGPAYTLEIINPNDNKHKMETQS